MAQSSLWYEKIKAIDDMSYSRFEAQGSGCYEQPRVVNDMKDLRSHEIRPLDVMNRLGRRMILMILHHELKPLDATNSSRLWMT